VIGTGDLVLQTIVSGMLHPGSIIRNDAALAGENRQ
jgi:hypothetical protein